MPSEEKLVPWLMKVVADPDGRGLLVMIDYYREKTDEATKTRIGFDFAKSEVYRMDHKNGSFTDRYEILPYEDFDANANNQVKRAYEFIGAVYGGYFVLSAVDSDGRMIIATYNQSSSSMRHFSIDIESDEMNYVAIDLSPGGILSALLSSKFEAKIVWWRFDKIIRGFGG
jgi:hypothetical protein